MDLLVCAYPLYLTHEYYLNQNDNSNLSFLTVWWSTFGMITLAENYASVNNLPFYWILKSGVMVSLYSADYRKWLTENALSTAAIAGKTLKNVVGNVVNEHFPKVKEYVNVSPATSSSTQSQNHGWFGGWFNSK